MAKKKNNEITLLHYKRLGNFRLAMIVVMALFAATSLFMVIIHIVQQSVITLPEWIFLFAFESTAIVAGLILLRINVLRKEIEVQTFAVRDFFDKPTFIYPEDMFVESVKKIGRVRGGHARGVMAAINVKGLHSDILNFYGPEAIREINSIVFAKILAHFDDLSRYRYGFSYLDSFLLYCKTNDPAVFYAELEALSKDVQATIREQGKIASITLLFGSYVLEKNDDFEEAVKRAIAASRHNDTVRFSDAVLQFSSDQMAADSNEKDLPFEIMRGMKEEQFQIFYQPKFDLKTNRFYGAEALVRWNHPQRGLLPPSFFVPFSEKSGLVVPMDHYIYSHVCQDIAKWQKEHKRLVKVSINISRRTIYDDGLIDFLADEIKTRNINPQSIDMEVTESLAAKDTAFLLQLVSKIKGLGMSTSIDDFGVGYSSFNSLKRLPFDTLKIDKSFVDDIEVDEKSRAIVNSIIQVSHNLGLVTIAEGVETKGQVELLRKMGCDAIQGYYYSRPLSNYEFQKFLSDNPFEKGGNAL